MVLRRLGKSVLLVERGSHPRFAIGESSTPFANLLLERLAMDYDLPFLRLLSEWGLWQEHFPAMPVGLKRGFTFYHHTFGEHCDFSDRTRQLLVAASPNDRVADTHWYRPDFDAFLVKQAEALGITYLDRTTISNLSESANEWTLTLTRLDQSRVIKTRFIIDATGPGGFLSQCLGLPTEKMFAMPPTSGVFAHFRDVARMDSIRPELRDPALPYPPDDAAVHHVFSGGWIWVLRFNNGITSAGAAFTPATQLRSLENPEAAWKELLQQLPSVAEMFRNATPITPFHYSPQLSFQRNPVCGQKWALLPATAGFVDPLLSTGFALSLLGVIRLGESFKNSVTLESFSRETTLDLQTTAGLVAALYQKMDRPEEFSLLTMLYFAALSYTETAWRLNRETLASDFLLRNNPSFYREFLRITETARSGAHVTHSEIERVIGPFDITGLTDWSRQNWYPVRFSDLTENISKLNASHSELEILFTKLGLTPAVTGWSSSPRSDI